MRNLLFCFSVFGVFLLKLGFGLLSSKEPYWPFELSRWEAGLLSSRPCPVWAQRPARPVNTAMGLARVRQHFIRGCQAAPQLGAAARVALAWAGLGVVLVLEAGEVGLRCVGPAGGGAKPESQLPISNKPAVQWAYVYGPFLSQFAPFSAHKRNNNEGGPAIEFSLNKYNK